MSYDGVCGSTETGTGEPCRRDPGWGTDRDHGPCADHSEDTESNVGRDRKLTKQHQEQIAEMLENGHSVSAACRCNGIGQSTFYEWLDKADQQDEGIYREFADRVARARGTGERELVDELLEMAREERDARTLLSVLKNRYPESWGESDAAGTTEERVEVYLTAEKD